MSAKNDQGRNGESQGRTAGPELGKTEAGGEAQAGGPELCGCRETFPQLRSELTHGPGCAGYREICFDCGQPLGSYHLGGCRYVGRVVAGAQTLLYGLSRCVDGKTHHFVAQRAGEPDTYFECVHCRSRTHSLCGPISAGSSQRWGWTCVVCGRFNAEGNGYCGETGKGCAASKSVTAEAWRREFDAEMGRIKAGSSRPVPEGIRAAALELYAALKALDPQCITVPPCHACAGCDARAALSKAEGRS